MTDQMQIAVMGCGGRMGRMLAKAVMEHPSSTLCGAVEREGSSLIGRDAGEALGLGETLEIAVSSDAPSTIAKSDAILDFTAPTATLNYAQLAAESGAVHVIGTTGFEDADFVKLDAAATRATLIRAGNMSLGVNLLTVLTQKVAEALDADFDIEIVETHHNQKVDAPSGTALMLGEAAAQGRGVTLNTHADRARDGITGAREKGHIGFAALRGGDVVGEHDVIFASAGERIVLRHIATDRMIFARGAVKAALWGRGKGPGAFDMCDVLGL